MSHQILKNKIESYRRKRYRNDIIRGIIFFLLISIGSFFTFSVLEDQFWFNSLVRTILFLILLGVSLSLSIIFILKPITELFRLRKGINDIDLSKEIGLSFPTIQDKLLNYLQLSQNTTHNELLLAALDQKTKDMQIVNFESSINIKKNLKYSYWLIGLLVIVSLAAFVSPSLLSESPRRIVNFNQEYYKPAPFTFSFQSSDYQAFIGEDFFIDLSLDGQNIPEKISLIQKQRVTALNPRPDGSYQLKFSNIKEDISFFVDAAGFESNSQVIKAVPRPELLQLKLFIDYPAYTGITDEIINNTGSKIVPQGTIITWELFSKNTNNIFLISDLDTSKFQVTNDISSTSRQILTNLDYQISLRNEFGQNKIPIEYSINIIEDEVPAIDLNFIPDTTLYQNLIIDGSIYDDYGFSSLYAQIKEIQSGRTHTINVPLNKSQNNQSFIQVLDIKPFIKENNSIEVAVYVKDNDQINGPKLAKSKTFYFDKPDAEALNNKLDDKQNDTQKRLEDAKSQSQELSQQIESLENKLKSKTNIGWQEEKLIETILKDRDKIETQLNKLKKEHEDLMNMQDKFDPNSDKLKKKSKELQKLIDELLDEETKKLYDELKKLLAEQTDNQKVKDQISKINKKENSLEKELERTLELFKRMKLEMEMQKTANALNKLGDKQEKLAQEENNQEEGSNEQSEINKEFEKIQEDIEKLNDLNQELSRPEPLSDLNDEGNEIQKDLDELMENMKTNDSKKTKSQQKDASDKMKTMASKMEQMQGGMEMEMMQENMQDLENIVDNLIKLSFEEERLIKEFQLVNQIDPRFIELSQDQLKLVKNTEVVKDSLTSLASRVVQISNFITREVSEISENLDNAMNELRERNKNKATSHQQYAMTSMNNLALLLGDVLEQMQMAMSEAMGKPKPGDKKQQGLPSMSQMQEQLSEQIQELKKSGKSGRQLSEELAQLAAEQSMLREEMRQLKEQLEGQPENAGAAKSLKEAIQKMEENEEDLVNKRLSNNLINRQEDIRTKMLEATDALREQKESPEREAQSAKDNYNDLTPAFEEYLKAKKAEIELLKTIPLDLSPFYKKEVNDYFQRLSSDK